MHTHSSLTQPDPYSNPHFQSENGSEDYQEKDMTKWDCIMVTMAAASYLLIHLLVCIKWVCACASINGGSHDPHTCCGWSHAWSNAHERTSASVQCQTTATNHMSYTIYSSMERCPPLNVRSFYSPCVEVLMMVVFTIRQCWLQQNPDNWTQLLYWIWLFLALKCPQWILSPNFSTHQTLGAHTHTHTSDALHWMERCPPLNGAMPSTEWSDALHWM
jgi:hypothetical protein